MSELAAMTAGQARADALAYLAQRRGTMEYRFVRYSAVADELYAMGMGDGSLLVDVGAGACDLDFYLRTERGWKGRYLPVDASIDGTDLEVWRPPVRADYFAAVEVLEHLVNARALAVHMIGAADGGVVVTTPNTDVLGTQAVRDMDATHVRPIFGAELGSWGFRVRTRSFFGQPDDSMLGTRSSR